MQFADEAAEDFYKDMIKKYGYVHINSNGPLTVEDLESVLNSIITLQKKKEK